jgi:protein-tyrosine-phosphatase
VLFMSTANSARSHLAAALWRQVGKVPAISAGTRPAPRIAPGATDAAARRRLPLPRLRPRHVGDVRHHGDLLVTVCDLAHEELGAQAGLHWSVPDPVPAGDPESFNTALADPDRRVRLLALRLAAAS